MKISKFKNIKCFSGDKLFDSKKEARRFNQLRILQLAGNISNLECQKKFLLQDGFTNNKGEKIRPIHYITDFYYFDNTARKWFAEDVKPAPNFKTDVYKIKKKLFEYKYPDIFLKEIF